VNITDEDLTNFVSSTMSLTVALSRVSDILSGAMWRKTC